MGNKRKHLGITRAKTVRRRLRVNFKKNKESCLKCQQDGCGKHFLDQKALDWHSSRVHKGVVPTICDWQNCGKRSTRTVNRSELPRRCINCSFMVPRQRPVHLLDELSHSALNVLSSWIAPGSITNGGILCVECFILIQARATSEVVPPPEFGHEQVCFGCGISLLRARCYRVSSECRERNVILRFTPVHQVSRLKRVCAACWRSANREVQRQQQLDANELELQEISKSINEPGFRTAEAAEAHIKSHYERAPHKCSKCEQGFDKFEDIKIHFLQNHTKWKEGESSTKYELPNISNKTETNIDKESTSSEPRVSDLRSWSFTPNASDNDDSSSDGVDFESFFENSKLKTQKVEITYECDWKNCGKCFDTTGDLEKHKKTHLGKHKKTHLVDKDTASEKCTKCDARFDSFELVKIHFLEAHTKWKKEEALDEGKDSENVTIVKKYAGNECKITTRIKNQGTDTKEKTKNNNSINILNRKETDKIFSAVTTKPRVKDFTPEDKDTLNEKQPVCKGKNTKLNNKQSGSKSTKSTLSTLNQKQLVPNLNNIVDDPKNTFVIFSDKAMDDSNKPIFYIVKTKPNLENSSIGPSRQIFQLVAENTATNVTNNIIRASCSSSFSENAKLTMSYAENLMPDLSSTSNIGNIMPVVGNATSIFANAIPIVGKITPNLGNMPVVGKITNVPVVAKITPNLANVPVVGTITPNLANVPGVGNITPDFGNVPAMGKNSPNFANVIPAMEKDTPDLANAIIPAEGNITPGLATFMSNMKKTTSYFAEELPVRVNIIPKAAKPNLGKNISDSNTISDAKTITSNEITKPEVSKINSMLANIIPVVRNLSYNAPNHGLLKVDHSFCHCSNCLDSSEHKINGKNVHRCDSCGDIFTTKYRLDKHMKTHTGAEPYFCPFKCGKRFSLKNERARHMRVHTKQEIFVCDICQKGFFRENLLKKHMTIHDKYPAETQVNADDDKLGNHLCQENTDDILMGNSEGDPIEMSDDDSDAEDNCKNSTSESSDENDSSDEENITNDNVEAPSLVEDEVCLDLGENIDNTTTDPLSGITNFEDMSVPLPQIIKREEETTDPMPEENMEILPVQRINTGEDIDLIAQIVNIREDSLDCMPLERTEKVHEGIKLVTEQVINTEECEEPMIQTVNIREDSMLERSMEIMPLNGVYGGVEPVSEIVINAEKCVETITQTENIRDYGIELMPLESIKSEEEGIEPILDHVTNTEEHVLSTPTQILNTGENSMEFTPSEIIKREAEDIDPISEQLINTEEESIDLIPAKRIKREEDNLNYILGQGINVADATLALRNLSGNKILRVCLERLPFDF